MKAIIIKTRFKILLSLTLIGFFASCNSGDNFKEESILVESTEITEDFNIAPPEKPKDLKSEVVTNNVTKDLKIIKTANSRYKVKSIKKAANDIKMMASKYDAYISDLRFENDQYKKEMRFTIKIPALYFDEMMDSVDVVSEFTDYENITTKDVTEEYVDLQARLNTKMEVKARYESILRKNAITVEDILATEDKLRIIQEEIESAKGRLNYLTNKVAYSTIQIDLYESVDFKEEPETYKKSFWSKMNEALKFGWDLIGSFIIGILYIWPIVLFGILVIVLIRYHMRKKK